eukprot:TRINITY_DN4608_c0_g1_i3.p1 TRINITY_DN4608_c0_g1~~TRINITY_DN4608_c0_g1_i3.p1  ORF type:complete len:355 (+),score=128.98 TRINITY_DN4608_c0_g1_i3:97-1161(+)
METRFEHVLIGDIGGTNARFQLAKVTLLQSEPEIIHSENLRTQEFTTIDDCIRAFLKPYVGTPQYPKIACLGVAGPVDNNSAKMGNIDWGRFYGDELSKTLGIPVFKIINDFEAIGYAILKVDIKNDVIVLNQGQARENAPITVYGPGTGLGYCNLISTPFKKDENRYYVLPGEGGHVVAYAYTELEFEYLQFVKKTWPTQVEFENIQCGPAIPKLYEFFKNKRGVAKTKLEEEIPAFQSSDVLTYGMQQKCEVCVDALDLFLALNGREAGNGALRMLSRGGLYLVGNLFNYLGKYLSENKDNAFIRTYFERNNVVKEILENVPVFIVTKPELGLLGAFVESQRILADTTNEQA